MQKLFNIRLIFREKMLAREQRQNARLTSLVAGGNHSSARLHSARLKIKAAQFIFRKLCLLQFKSGSLVSVA